MISFIIQFFIEQKCCKHDSLLSRKQQNDKTRQLTIQENNETINYSSIYLLFELLWCQKSIS